MRKISIFTAILFVLLLMFFCIVIYINSKKVPTTQKISVALANHLITGDYYSWQIYGFVYSNFYITLLRLVKDGVYEKDMIKDRLGIPNLYKHWTTLMRNGISYSYLPEKFIEDAMLSMNFTELTRYEDYVTTKIKMYQYTNDTTVSNPDGTIESDWYTSIMAREAGCKYLHVRMADFALRDYENSTNIPIGVIENLAKDPEEDFSRKNNNGELHMKYTNLSLDNYEYQKNLIKYMDEQIYYYLCVICFTTFGFLFICTVGILWKIFILTRFYKLLFDVSEIGLKEEIE